MTRPTLGKRCKDSKILRHFLTSQTVWSMRLWASSLAVETTSRALLFSTRKSSITCCTRTNSTSSETIPLSSWQLPSPTPSRERLLLHWRVYFHVPVWDPSCLSLHRRRSRNYASCPTSLLVLDYSTETLAKEVSAWKVSQRLLTTPLALSFMNSIKRWLRSWNKVTVILCTSMSLRNLEMPLALSIRSSITKMSSLINVSFWFTSLNWRVMCRYPRPTSRVFSLNISRRSLNSRTWLVTSLLSPRTRSIPSSTHSHRSTLNFWRKRIWLFSDVNFSRSCWNSRIAWLTLSPTILSSKARLYIWKRHKEWDRLRSTSLPILIPRLLVPTLI